MRPLLMICPSRGRPKRAREMIESFFATMNDAELILCLDQDDPLLTEYENIHYAYFLTTNRMTTTEFINTAFERLPNYKYYGITNDDFIYRTQNWDAELIKTIQENGDGIAYGNDLGQRGDLPTSFIVSRLLVHALGWLQQPGLTHLYNDNVWKHIGQALGRLYYREDVVIEHRHWINDHSLMDDTYKQTNSQEMYQKDEDAFKRWLSLLADKDIARIKSFLSGTWLCRCGKEALYHKGKDYFCNEHWEGELCKSVL